MELARGKLSTATYLRLWRVTVVQHAQQPAAVRRHAGDRLRLQRLPSLLRHSIPSVLMHCKAISRNCGHKGLKSFCAARQIVPLSP